MARERDLPPLVDFGASIDRIEEEADADVEGHIDDLREGLDRLEERDDQERESVLDDVDDTLLSLRERVDDEDADSSAEGIQNRIRQYRDNRGSEGNVLSLSNARLERAGESVEPEDVAAETVQLRGTLVNGGAGDGALYLAFYDGEGRLSRTVESRQYDLEAGEHREFDRTVYVPADADSYVLATLDAADSSVSAVPTALDGEDESASEEAHASEDNPESVQSDPNWQDDYDYSG
jgi:hypothetical protein